MSDHGKLEEAEKTIARDQRVAVSFQRAPAPTDVVVHRARKLDPPPRRAAHVSRRQAGRPVVHCNRRLKKQRAESMSCGEFPESGGRSLAENSPPAETGERAGGESLAARS